MQHVFGAGFLVGTALTDYTGTALATPTPVQFGVLQEVSIDISFDVKELYGNRQFPIAIGRGKGKIGLKAKYAQLNGLMMNSLLFGQTLATGTLGEVIDLVGAVIPTTPFTITPTVPSSGTWTNDLGVVDTNGIPYQRVVSGPMTGQYSVSAGAYVFATADAGKTVFISFQYTATSTVAKKMTIINPAMGAAPTFRADLLMPFGGKQAVLSLNNCTSTKFSLATKLDDFGVPEIDMSAFADGSGVIGTIGLAE